MAPICGFGKRGLRNFRIRAEMTVFAGLLFFAYILSGPVPKHLILTNCLQPER